MFSHYDRELIFFKKNVVDQICIGVTLFRYKVYDQTAYFTMQSVRVDNFLTSR
jgi:hypothetical protein